VAVFKQKHDPHRSDKGTSIFLMSFFIVCL